MLGRTAGDLFWASRYLERMENTARLLEAGNLISLSQTSDDVEVWRSIIATEGMQEAFEERDRDYTQVNVVNFLLRDPDHENSAVAVLARARDIMRAARTVVTSEIWVAVNTAWMELTAELKGTIRPRDLPERLRRIQAHSQMVRGAVYGSALRNDAFDFLRCGTHIERLEATARILDVKYHLLLPSLADVGSPIDQVQWEWVLRSVSAFDGFHWLHHGALEPAAIADFLIFDQRFPRSIAYCAEQIRWHLASLALSYDMDVASVDHATELVDDLGALTVSDVIARGLHESVESIVDHNIALASRIERDFRFYG